MGKLIIYTLLAFLLFSSCEKEEGIGGKNVIEGQVFWQDVLTDPILGITDSIVAEYPASNEKVFIIYGNDNGFYNDDVNTSYDGKYKFEWLKEGDYTIYALHNCEEDNCGDKQETRISYSVNISSRKSTTQVPHIYLKNRISK